MKKLFKAKLLLIILLLNVSCTTLFKNKEKKDLVKQEELSRMYVMAFHLNFVGNHEEAKQVLKKIAAKCSNHAASRFDLARMYAVENKLNDALKYAKDAFKIDPENKWYELLLIDIYEKTGNIKQQIFHYKNLIQKYPEDLNFYYDLANLYLRSKDVRNSLEILNKIESKIGITEEISIQKYRLLIETKNDAAAINELKKLAAEFPDQIEYQAIIGKYYLNTKNYEKALNYFTIVYENDTTNTESKILLAETYLRLGNNINALKYFKNLIESDIVKFETKADIIILLMELSLEDEEIKNFIPELLTIFTNQYPNDVMALSIEGEFYFRNENYKEAIKTWEKLLDIDKSNFKVWDFLMHTLNITEDYEKLLDVAINSSKLFPEQSKPLFYRGLAYYFLKKDQEAAEFFEKALKLETEDRFVILNALTILGQVYNRLGLDSLLFDAYDRALKFDNNNTIILNNYAYYLALRGIRLDEAVKMSQQALNNSPNSSYILDTHAWVLYKKGQYNKAESYIIKAIQNAEKANSVYYEHYAEILVKLLRNSEAKEFFLKAIEAGGDASLLNERINSLK